MISQQFSSELDKKLWAADRLRSNLGASVYKHAVLGLIFFNYVSDSSAQRRAEIAAMLKNSKSDFFFDPKDYSSPEKYEATIHTELEDWDYRLEQNVFRVPALARWKTVQDSAKLAPGTEITVRNGKATTYKITSTGKLIDDALEAIEKVKPKLKGVLDRHYIHCQIHPVNLSSLVYHITSIAFQHADLHVKSIFGHVYEYFLGQFALAEGKKGGQPSGTRQTRPKASPKGRREGANQYFPKVSEGARINRVSSRIWVYVQVIIPAT